MRNPSSPILCDGCGLPASAEHIAERVRRLESSTRFRPIHINVLFVVSEPGALPGDDFYGPPESRDFFDPFLSSLGISGVAGNLRSEMGETERNVARLNEFQRRGYFLAYFSECPGGLPSSEVVTDTVSRLGQTFVKRVRFNYKPKKIALLGSNLRSMIGVFEKAGMASLLLLHHGEPLAVPNSGDQSSLTHLREAFSLDERHAESSSGV